MKVIIKKQFDKCGDEYLDETDFEIGVEKVDDDIIIEFEDTLLIIPVSVFFGILSD